MAKVIVHWDGANVQLEWIAPRRPDPTGANVIDSSQVPVGKQDWMDWNGTSLQINPTKRAQYNARDRRSREQKIIDVLIAKGIITPQDVS